MKQMICCVMFGGGSGCFVFFGINGSFSMNLQLTGKMDVVNTLFEKGNAEAIIGVLGHTVFGIAAVIAFVVITVLFLATTLDSAAFSLSASSTKQLEENVEYIAYAPFILVYNTGLDTFVHEFYWSFIKHIADNNYNHVLTIYYSDNLHDKRTIYMVQGRWYKVETRDSHITVYALRLYSYITGARV